MRDHRRASRYQTVSTSIPVTPLVLHACALAILGFVLLNKQPMRVRSSWLKVKGNNAMLTCHIRVHVPIHVPHTHCSENTECRTHARCSRVAWPRALDRMYAFLSAAFTDSRCMHCPHWTFRLGKSDSVTFPGQKLARKSYRWTREKLLTGKRPGLSALDLKWEKFPLSR